MCLSIVLQSENEYAGRSFLLGVDLWLYVVALWLMISFIIAAEETSTFEVFNF
jgi:hypothetical protein